MGEFGVGSRGAGGGTISTAALYYEMYDVLDENITFVEACEALFAARLPGRIHAMTDVTNGGGANSAGFITNCTNGRIPRIRQSPGLKNLKL